MLEALNQNNKVESNSAPRTDHEAMEINNLFLDLQYLEKVNSGDPVAMEKRKSEAISIFSKIERLVAESSRIKKDSEDGFGMYDKVMGKAKNELNKILAEGNNSAGETLH